MILRISVVKRHSLNASIEASKQSKRFCPVAQEISQLASQTQEVQKHDKELGKKFIDRCHFPRQAESRMVINAVDSLTISSVS